MDRVGVSVQETHRNRLDPKALQPQKRVRQRFFAQLGHYRPGCIETFADFLAQTRRDERGWQLELQIVEVVAKLPGNIEHVLGPFGHQETG